MDDIGPSPDWRSGIHDRGRCDICDEVGDAYYLERCDICNRVICPQCRYADDVQIVCLVCDEGA